MRSIKKDTRTQAKNWLVENGYVKQGKLWHSDNGKKVARIEKGVVSGFKVIEECNW